MKNKIWATERELSEAVAGGDGGAVHGEQASLGVAHGRRAVVPWIVGPFVFRRPVHPFQECAHTVISILGHIYPMLP